MYRKTSFALAAAALCASPPLGSQTASITMEAESMTRSSYALEGSLIKLTASSGSATQSFNGASGTYNIQVRVLLENDGQSSLELYKGSTRLYTYRYPLGNAIASFTVNNVALASGDSIRLVGRVGGDAWARVDKIVFTPVATSIPITGTGTTTPSTSYTGTPYTGTSVALPKAFAAANFDNGGQGVAYRDLSTGNIGKVYRTTEDVDLVSSTDSSANGYAVSNIQSGEWLNYTVNVPADGKYDLAIRASSNQSTPAAFHIEVDGVNVTGPISVPKTSTWGTFQWVGKQGVNLTQGRRVLKVVADTQYFNMAAVSVLASATTSAPAAAASALTATSGTTPLIVGDGVGSVPPKSQSVPVPSAAGGTVQFSCSFENSPTDCGFREQAKVPGRATLVNIARVGSRAVRLHTQPGDNNVSGSGTRERNDLYLSQAASDCSQGKTAWWAHSLLFPSDFVLTDSGLALDFHHSGSDGQANFHLRVRNDSGLSFEGGGGATVATQTMGPGRFHAPIGPIVKNQWYDFVYNVKWSSGSDGFFYAWVNGVQKLAYRGPTLYAGQGCYLKLANYHSASTASSIIHDRIMRGTSASAVSLTPLEGVQ